jgi:hypothetical protein
MQSNNLSNALFLRLQSKGLQIVPADCKRGNQIAIQMHPDKVDCAVQIFKKIVDSADIYYGIRAGQLSEALTDKVVKIILRDYSELSVDDIDYAFERYRKEKNDWRNITFDELIAPLAQYHKVKYAVNKEMAKLQKEIEENEDRIEKDKEFLKISEDLYEESVSGSMFLGDVFHARKIYGNLIGRINEDTLKDMQQNAIRESRELSETNPFLHLSHSPERIYAKMVVDYGILNKMPLKLK